MTLPNICTCFELETPSTFGSSLQKVLRRSRILTGRMFQPGLLPTDPPSWCGRQRCWGFRHHRWPWTHQVWRIWSRLSRDNFATASNPASGPWKKNRYEAKNETAQIDKSASHFELEKNHESLTFMGVGGSFLEIDLDCVELLSPDVKILVAKILAQNANSIWIT